MRNFVITGSASGLGKEIYRLINQTEGMKAFGVDKDKGINTDINIDIRELWATSGAIASRFDGFHEIYGLINCAGVNYINNMEDIPEEQWYRVMDTNAKGIWLMAKGLMPLLEKSKGVILNIVSNAAHIPMTHSIAYNASKAAALMMTKQMSRELTKSKGITVFSISPNKLKGTGMSTYIEKTVLELRPDLTADQAKQYQLNALPAGFETDPKHIAELIVWLLEKPHRHKYLTGCDLQLGA